MPPSPLSSLISVSAHAEVKCEITNISAGAIIQKDLHSHDAPPGSLVIALAAFKGLVLRANEVKVTRGLNLAERWSSRARRVSWLLLLMLNAAMKQPAVGNRVAIVMGSLETIAAQLEDLIVQARKRAAREADGPPDDAPLQ